MLIPKNVTDSVKSTIGYAEAVDKNSFMIGADVAFSKAEEFYKKTIESLTTQLSRSNKSYEEVEKDMKTIVNIFEKYNY